jgi:hypothetical protein
MEKPSAYKPSAFYFRTELRAARTKREAVQIGLHVIAELERLKAWVRDQDMIPPKWNLMPSEICEKGWADVIVFPPQN